jgi:hypothetical protein
MSLFLKMLGRGEIVKFVLLFTGRSGSSYLMDLLDSHPDIRAQGEILASATHLGAEDQLKHVREFFSPGVLRAYKVIGFKTKLVDIFEPTDFSQLLHEMKCRIIVMNRENVVKSVVSRIFAERIYETYSEWNITKQSMRLPPIDIAPDIFENFLQHKEKVEEELFSFVESIQLPKTFVTYEDLLRDPQRCLKGILEFLDVPSVPLNSDIKKHTSDNLRQVVSNFSEIRAKYVGTRYESMFDEVVRS